MRSSPCQSNVLVVKYGRRLIILAPIADAKTGAEWIVGVISQLAGNLKRSVVLRARRSYLCVNRYIVCKPCLNKHIPTLLLAIYLQPKQTKKAKESAAMLAVGILLRRNHDRIT